MPIDPTAKGPLKPRTNDRDWKSKPKTYKPLQMEDDSKRDTIKKCSKPAVVIRMRPNSQATF